jgi:site-specific recombinase XerD
MPHLEAWQRDLERRLAPRTVEAYVSDVAALAEYAGDRLDELHHREIQRYLDAQSGGAKTAARKQSSYDSYFGFLVRKRYRQGNPMDLIDRPRIRRNAPDTIPHAHHRIAKLEPPYRWIAELIYETGMTMGEVFSIDVDPAHIGDRVMVEGRTVRITDPARTALRRLGGRIAIENDMSLRTVERRFREAGLSARGLRHTFADELAERGADLETIAEILGLSLASARIYARGKAAAHDRVGEALERRLRSR